MGVADADSEAGELIYMHTLAIGYSRDYLAENSSGIRQGWPRIPLPASRDVLMASAALGRQVAALLDTEIPLKGVTSGTPRPELKAIAVVSRVGGGKLNPGAGDLAVSVGWGYAGQGGATMPGKGKIVERDYTHVERAAIEAGAKALGFNPEEAFTHLGETTNDIYLNERAYWTNVPVGVWDYVIGGYRVIKKWLSYREKELLGRPLTTAEAREVSHMTRRIAAILLLGSQLDINYRSVEENVYAWPSGESLPK